MRLLLTSLAFVVSLVVTAAIAFFAVMVLAGPHSSLLPQPLQIVALVLGWCAVLAVPILVARKVWLRWS